MNKAKEVIKVCELGDLKGQLFFYSNEIEVYITNLDRYTGEILACDLNELPENTKEEIKAKYDLRRKIPDETRAEIVKKYVPQVQELADAVQALINSFGTKVVNDYNTLLRKKVDKAKNNMLKGLR